MWISNETYNINKFIKKLLISIWKNKETRVKNQWSTGGKTVNNVCKTSLQHARKQCTTFEKPVNMWMCVSKLFAVLTVISLDWLVVKKKECPFLNPTPQCGLQNGTCFTGDVPCPPGLICRIDNTCEAKCTQPALKDGKNYNKIIIIILNFVGDKVQGLTMAGILCCISLPGGVLVIELRPLLVLWFKSITVWLHL